MIPGEKEVNTRKIMYYTCVLVEFELEIDIKLYYSVIPNGAFPRYLSWSTTTLVVVVM